MLWNGRGAPARAAGNRIRPFVAIPAKCPVPLLCGHREAFTGVVAAPPGNFSEKIGIEIAM
jgi:hypothetical protein